jgi:hypothetical protein
LQHNSLKPIGIAPVAPEILHIKCSSEQFSWNQDRLGFDSGFRNVPIESQTFLKRKGLNRRRRKSASLYAMGEINGLKINPIVNRNDIGCGYIRSLSGSTNHASPGLARNASCGAPHRAGGAALLREGGAPVALAVMANDAIAVMAVRIRKNLVQGFTGSSLNISQVFQTCEMFTRASRLGSGLPGRRLSRLAPDGCRHCVCIFHRV